LEREDPRIIEAIPNWTYGIESYGLQDRSCSIWSKYPQTAAALMYVLRYTGLRISDAIMFEPHDLVKRTINGKEVYCYFLPRQEKTDEPVFCVVPPDVAEYILAAPRLSDAHAFYVDERTGETMEHQRQWNTRFRQNVMRYLERVSGVPNIHPHRFRDTFSVDLIVHGVDIRIVSRLLGHTDVATTLKSYEHWLPGDQTTAAEGMMKTWDSKKKVLPFKPRKQA
jgi:integrase